MLFFPPPNSASKRGRIVWIPTYIDAKTAPRSWKAAGRATAISRLPSMVTMTITWMIGRFGSYLLVIHAMRYQTHHMASSRIDVP